MPDEKSAKPLHLARRFILLLVLALAGLLVIIQPGTGLPLQDCDKQLHLAAFTMIAMVTAWAFPAVRLSRLLLALVALGGLTELAQALPFVAREADWLDFLANAVAVGVTLFVVAVVRCVFPGSAAARK